MKTETVFLNIGENPVTLEEMKEYLRVSNEVEDDVIESLISTATEWCEQYTNKAMREMDVEALFTNLNGERTVDLPFSPIYAVEAVYIAHSDGTFTEIETGYEVTGLREKTITFPIIYSLKGTAGYKVEYTTMAKVPNFVKDVIRKMVAEMYGQRAIGVEGVNYHEGSMLSYMKLLHPHKREVVL